MPPSLAHCVGAGDDLAGRVRPLRAAAPATAVLALAREARLLGRIVNVRPAPLGAAVMRASSLVPEPLLTHHLATIAGPLGLRAAGFMTAALCAAVNSAECPARAMQGMHIWGLMRPSSPLVGMAWQPVATGARRDRRHVPDGRGAALSHRTSATRRDPGWRSTFSATRICSARDAVAGDPTPPLALQVACLN